MWPPFRRRSRSPRLRVGFIAPGWIETVSGGVEEGLFDAGNELAPPPWLTFLPRAGRGAPRVIRWPAVEAVEVLPRAVLADPVAAAHRDSLMRSRSGELVQGWIRAGGDSDGRDLFIVVPMSTYTAADWVSRFRGTGVRGG